MRRALCIIMILIVLSFGGIAFADNTIKIKELGLSIYPPDDWIVITRDTFPDDECFKTIGADGMAFADNLKKSNIYLCCIRDDQMAEILVTMEQDSNAKSIYDFNLLNDKQLEEFANELMDMNSEEILKSAGKDDKQKDTYKDLCISNYRRYEHDQAKFVVLDSYIKVNDKPVYGRQYTTIINGQAIKVLLNSYGKKLTDELAKDFHNVVGNIVFDEVKEKPEDNGILSFGKVIRAVKVGLICGAIFVIACILFNKFKTIRDINRKKGL